MIRTQISLTEEQMSRLREAAAQRGVSVAHVVRDAIDAELARDDADDRVELARETLGAYQAGGVSLGRDHDDHLAEAYEDWRE